MLARVNPLEGKTTNWRAVYGKSACTVRREGEPRGSSYPYNFPVFPKISTVTALGISCNLTDALPWIRQDGFNEAAIR